MIRPRSCASDFSTGLMNLERMLIAALMAIVEKHVLSLKTSAVIGLVCITDRNTNIILSLVV